MLNNRSYEKEIIDSEPALYTIEEYEDCLVKLERVGLLLGGNAASFHSLASIPGSFHSILDVGCGGGFFTLAMAKKFPEAAVVGIEINPQAIAFAKKSLHDQAKVLDNVTFMIKDRPELNELPKSYDVVIATLVCHHMDDEALIDFLRRACLIARKRVIINDLHRHPIALLAFKGLSPLFFRNRLVMHDGPLSIKRAFKKSDWKFYLKKAGIQQENYAIRWKWAFRFIVEIDCTLP